MYKKISVVLCLMFVAFMFIRGCDNGPLNSNEVEAGNKNIEAVKDMTVSVPLFNLSGRVGEGVVKMAGIDGTAKWSTFKPEKYKDNDNITGVEAVVNCKGKNGKPHTATFQFLINSESGFMELASYMLDGKAKTKMEATLALVYGAI